MLRRRVLKLSVTMRLTHTLLTQTASGLWLSTLAPGRGSVTGYRTGMCRFLRKFSHLPYIDWRAWFQRVAMSMHYVFVREPLDL